MAGFDKPRGSSQLYNTKPVSGVETIESPLKELILYLAKNAKYLTPEAQSAIARYIDVQTTPMMMVVTTDLQSQDMLTDLVATDPDAKNSLSNPPKEPK